METRVTVAGKTWIVPQMAVASLVNWLQQNAVEVGAPRTEVREVLDVVRSDRQLITENEQ